MGKYERIKNLREDKDLTQKQLADALFMQLTQYRRYESGEREIPLELAISLSEFYNVPIDYIAGVSDKIIISDKALTADEANLLRNFRKLQRSDRKRLLEISEIMKN